MPVTDVLGIIGKIGGICDKIYQQVEKVQANKRQVIRLGERVRVVHSGIQGLHGRANAQGFVPALQKLQLTLTQIETVVTKLAMERGLLAGIKKFIRAQSREGELQDYSLSLQSCCIELQLGLQVQSFVDDKQNNQDLRDDIQYISQQEAEIFNELKAQLQRQNQLDQKNTHYQQVVQQQLDCFRQEFRQYVNPQVKPKSDLLPHDLRIPLDEISFNQYLTSGSFGQIFLGTHNGREVIIKQIKGVLSQEEKQQFVREVQIMSRLRSPYITQLYGAYASEELNTSALAAGAIPKETQLFYIMEYAPRGDLKQVLSKETLPEKLRGKISLELAYGLNYLHTQTTPYLHRDLKPENVLLAVEYGVKLADFGLAKAATASVRTIKERSTAFNYMSPEFLRGDTYNLAAEVYSFGRLLWYIWSNTEPAYGAGLEALPVNIPQPYRDIITACLDEPARRPMMAEIVKRLQTLPVAAVSIEVAPALDAESLYRQGQAFEAKHDAQRAVEYYERAAASGHAGAKANLATLICQGKAGSAKDYQRAYQLYTAAGRSGHLRSQFMAGLMLEKGEGCEQNSAQALEWYQRAAASGHTESATKVATLAQQLKKG